MLDFTGRVAIVTGAGNGVGRATAKALARRGAMVVVNDYGGSIDTLTPGSIAVAQAVVDEIRAEGGEAVAEGSSVGTAAAADAIVGTALKAFGRVDILVNNAGGSTAFTTVDGDSDAVVQGVIDSNLTGSWMLLRKVWPLMREAGYGRIINTASNTLLGMNGAFAYVVAKGGVLGLTTAAAVEGRPLGILVNAVFPQAYTRGVSNLDGSMDWFLPFTPELVAEGVVFLCSEQCEAAGELFRIGGGGMGRYAIHGNRGIRDQGLTAEMVAEQFDVVRDMGENELLTSTVQDMTRFGTAAQLP